jgi:hypothetical protein
MLQKVHNSLPAETGYKQYLRRITEALIKELETIDNKRLADV